MTKKAITKMAVAKKDLPFTKNQGLFVLEFIEDLNATKAYSDVIKSVKK